MLQEFCTPFRIASELKTIHYNPKMSGWSLESGYDNSGVKQEENTGTKRARRAKEVYPIRVFNAKESSTLAISFLMNEKDFEYSCRGMVPGVRIFLHTPGEVQPTLRHSFRLPLNEEVQILMRPKMITTSEKLLKYRPEQRKCFFNSERKLSFFKIYTQRNCEMECLANYTLLSCQCVRFSMPSKLNFIQIPAHKYIFKHIFYLLNSLIELFVYFQHSNI